MTCRGLALSKLSEIIGGRLDTDGADPLVTGIASIESAETSQITFLSTQKSSARYRDKLKDSKACAVIASEQCGPLGLPAIRFKDSHYGLLRTLEFFHQRKRPPEGIHPTAFVHETAEIQPGAVVGPMTVVEKNAIISSGAFIEAQCHIGENCIVGKNTHFYPRVTLLRNCTVGSDCVVNSGAVIGSDGFGFLSDSKGHTKIPQVGNVVIHDRVEIGANVTIDRATMGSTIIDSGTKIDNLVHLAHNVRVGKDCIIVGQVGISGSTTLEDRVTMAGQSGTVGHVTVGTGSTVAARGVVTQDVDPGSMVSGFPLKPHSEEKRIMASLRRLPDLIKQVKALQIRLEEKEKNQE